MAAALFPAGAGFSGRIASAADSGPSFFSSEPYRTSGTSPSEDPRDAGRDKAGKVVALAEAGTKIFLGGYFAGVTPPGVGTKAAQQDPTLVVHRPYLVALDVTSGALTEWDAHPDGPVLALALSADGTKLYVGGMFSSIGGRRTPRLAVLDVATGSADPNFTPPTPNAYVRALGLDGPTLFIGGAFTTLGTTGRPQLAALDAASGALLTNWNPPPNTGGHFGGQTGTSDQGSDPGNISDLKVAAGGTVVVVGGNFLHFGGRSGLIALDVRTGRPTAWQPALDQPRPVYGTDVWPVDDRTIYVAAGGKGGAVEAFTIGGGAKPVWVHKTDGDGTDVVATPQRVYFIGHFDYVLGSNTTCGPTSCAGGNPGDNLNRHIAAFDATNGAQDLNFNAQFNTAQGPEVALIGAGHLYVGGDFTRVNFVAHPGFAQFSPASSGA